jgi:hypothetical protein
MPKFIKTQLPALVTALAFAGATGGCSFQHRDAAKTDNAVAQRPVTDAAAELRAQNEMLANSVALMSALAVLQATSALMPPVMAGGGAPVPAPALVAVPTPAPAEPQIVYVPVPAAEAPPTIVNNYYVQQAPESAPAPAAAAEQPTQVVYVGVGGGFGQPGFGNRGQGNRGQAAPAPATTAPAGQNLSSGSMVARALPLDSGAMVARGSGLTAPPNTSGLLFTPGTGTVSGTQRGGQRGGGGG